MDMERYCITDEIVEKLRDYQRERYFFAQNGHEFAHTEAHGMAIGIRECMEIIGIEPQDAVEMQRWLYERDPEEFDRLFGFQNLLNMIRR
jgi:hypothetical protein